MTGLFISLEEYYTDPIEEEFEEYLNETYYLIPSISNFKGWDEPATKKKGRPRGVGSKIKILKRGTYTAPPKKEKHPTVSLGIV